MEKHKRWSPGTLMAQAYRDIANEHNATVDALEAALAAQPPIRVPFTDAQIEAMAKACRNKFECDDRWEQSAYQEEWKDSIRAALAAGGLEPCAVPEYEPPNAAFPISSTIERNMQLEKECEQLTERLARVSAKSTRRAKALKECHRGMARLRKPHDELYRVAYDKFSRTLDDNARLREEIKRLENNDHVAVPERASDEELDAVFEEGCEGGALLGIEGIRAVRARVEAPLLAEIEACDLARYAAVLERDTLAARVAELEARNLAYETRLADVDGSIKKYTERLDGFDLCVVLGQNDRMESECNKLRAELEAAQAERDKNLAEWKAAQSTFEETHRAYLEANQRAYAAQAECKHLNAIICERQPVDADAWKTPLVLTAPNKHKLKIHGDDDAVSIENTAYAVNTTVGVVLDPADAARVAAHLASYAAAHGCPVSLPTPHEPTAAEVEALARVLDAAHTEGWTNESDPAAKKRSARLNQARAAFAHIGAGAPIASADALEKLAEIGEQTRITEERRLVNWNGEVSPEIARSGRRAAVAAILRAAKARVDIKYPDLIKALNEHNTEVSNEEWDVTFQNLLNSRIVYGVEVPSPAGPTRAEAEAKIEEVAQKGVGSRYPDFLDWLLPQLPTERAEASTKPVLTEDDLWRLMCPLGKEQQNALGVSFVEYDREDVDKLLTALRPWLLTPTGWELDVASSKPMEQEVKELMWNFGADLDALCVEMVKLFRSHIRPTFGPCKECEKLKLRLEDSQRMEGKRLEVMHRYEQDIKKAHSVLSAALEGE